MHQQRSGIRACIRRVERSTHCDAVCVGFTRRVKRMASGLLLCTADAENPSGRTVRGRGRHCLHSHFSRKFNTRTAPNGDGVFPEHEGHHDSGRYGPRRRSGCQPRVTQISSSPVGSSKTFHWAPSPTSAALAHPGSPREHQPSCVPPAPAPCDGAGLGAPRSCRRPSLSECDAAHSIPSETAARPGVRRMRLQGSDTASSNLGDQKFEGDHSSKKK